MRQVLIIAGISLLLAGLFFPYVVKVWHFLDQLPGNIRIKRNGFNFYFPLATCLVLSIVFSLLFNFLRKR